MFYTFLFEKNIFYAPPPSFCRAQTNQPGWQFSKLKAPPIFQNYWLSLVWKINPTHKHNSDYLISITTENIMQKTISSNIIILGREIGPHIHLGGGRVCQRVAPKYVEVESLNLIWIWIILFIIIELKTWACLKSLMTAVKHTSMHYRPCKQKHQYLY